MTIITIISLFFIWIISSFIVTGWFFAELQATFSETPRRKKQSERVDLTIAVFVGILYGLLGPVGVYLSWVVTSCAEHGWRLPYKQTNV